MHGVYPSGCPWEEVIYHGRRDNQIEDSRGLNRTSADLVGLQTIIPLSGCIDPSFYSICIVPTLLTPHLQAETSHNLWHWRYALKDWVDARLEDEGWLKADKLAEREKMKPKKRRKLANQIVDDWESRDIIKHLFFDFKQNLELARNKPTSVRKSGRR